VSKLKTHLTKPLLFRWVNHHDKNFKPGDLEVTFTLPAGTEVTVEARRTINAGKIYNYATLDLCDITFKNPLSGVTSGAIVTAGYLE
jgi:hypothetical protein